ncbi:tetratricopeptide repeat protein [Ensifer sp.]|jgi:Flp pilus assembly protein TadD|uniref:tetratricopeptide repeat protein n=1 Tax=Ensifer sp. TaxID=1872086 RepID=UPI002E1269BE|nr:tetratricopeptide repeat protein [Ensifer sp.]
MRQVLEKLLLEGKDDALLRFTLANACLQDGECETALAHVQRAIAHNPNYSAAWKLQGAILHKLGRFEEALDVWRKGRTVAEQNGDLQAAREIGVFVKRLERQCIAANGNE